MNTPIPYTSIPMIQIDEAIRLYHNNNFICAYTLAGAAEGVLRGILENDLKIEDHSFTYTKSRLSEMFGLSQKEIGKFLRINRNALNHYTP